MSRNLFKWKHSQSEIIILVFVVPECSDANIPQAKDFIYSLEY